MSHSQRLTSTHGALVVVDVQEKLIGAICDRELVVSNSVRLVRGAEILGMPYWATEQYPRGLGETISELRELIPVRPAKLAFHACAAPQILEQLYGRQIRHVTLAGIEAHVCIAQTALELINLGFRVQVAADAVGSRSKFDWEFALRRLEHAGVVVSTTEAVLFEWTETADRPQFKAISELIKLSGTPQRVDS